MFVYTLQVLTSENGYFIFQKNVQNYSKSIEWDMLKTDIFCVVTEFPCWKAIHN